MLAAIVKREFIDHLLSLRFSLADGAQRPQCCRRLLRIPPRPLYRASLTTLKNKENTTP